MKNGKLWILVVKSGKVGGMKLFLGEYEHSLDDRGRVILPRKIRSELIGGEVIVARGFEACIFGFDPSSWELEAKKQLEVPITDRESREIRRYMFSAAERVEIDKLGRILMPAQLKEYAHIQTNVAVIGAGDHFEIWDKIRWEEYRRSLNHHE